MAVVLTGSPQYIDLDAHGAALDVRQLPLTLYVEVKAPIDGVMFLLSHGRSGSNQEWALLWVNNEFMVSRWNADSVAGANTLDNTFHRICVRYYASGPSMEQYLDGDSVLIQGLSSVDAQDLNDLTAIGRDSGADQFYFVGEVSNVAVWDTDIGDAVAENLSAGRITPLDLPTGLLGYWPLDYDARDLSGNVLDGTLVGAPSFTGSSHIQIAGRNSATGSGVNQLTLPSVEGNLQVVFSGHRTESLSFTIDGDGWSSAILEETEIADTNARRAVVMWWRVVPVSQSTTINVNSSIDTGKATSGYELSNDIPGGIWRFNPVLGSEYNVNDNGLVATDVLASNSVTPQFPDSITLMGMFTRHGLPPEEDGYGDEFTAGEGIQIALTANAAGMSTGYRISHADPPVAISTTARWTTAALATSIIGTWSVEEGGVVPNVIGQVVEQNTPQIISPVVDINRTILPVTENNAPQLLGKAKQKEIAQVVEQDLGISIGDLKEVVQVIENNSPIGIGLERTYLTGRVTEETTVRNMLIPGAVGVSRVEELNIPQVILWSPKIRIIERVTENNIANSVLHHETIRLGRVIEQSQLLAIAAEQGQFVSRVIEENISRNVFVPQALLIARVTELNLARFIASGTPLLVFMAGTGDTLSTAGAITHTGTTGAGTRTGAT